MNRKWRRKLWSQNKEAFCRSLEARAGQGFSAIHSMLLSEAGWGNAGGPPWQDLGAERINPADWQEVDGRLASANGQGLVVGLALAEARTRPAPEGEVRREFVAIGDALHAADPHGRMIAIHPMTSGGSVREFSEAAWMALGDYQQNYHDLHERILQSRSFNKPVVNSEYGYHLRDQDGDGVPDKDNSTSLEAIRHATWDVVMAGGYVVTGFETCNESRRESPT